MNLETTFIEFCGFVWVVMVFWGVILKVTVHYDYGVEKRRLEHEVLQNCYFYCPKNESAM